MARLAIDRHAFAELIQAAACNLPPNKWARLKQEAAWFFEQASDVGETSTILDLERPLRSKAV